MSSVITMDSPELLRLLEKVFGVADFLVERLELRITHSAAVLTRWPVENGTPAVQSISVTDKQTEPFHNLIPGNALEYIVITAGYEQFVRIEYGTFMNGTFAEPFLKFLNNLE